MHTDVKAPYLHVKVTGCREPARQALSRTNHTESIIKPWGSNTNEVRVNCRSEQCLKLKINTLL